MTDRKYRMLRLAEGDYLLPSNDAATTWRLRRSWEDGSAIVEDALGRSRPLRGWFWEAYRFVGRTAQEMAESIEENDWTLWDCWASTLRTRREATDYALTTSQAEEGRPHR